LEEKIGGGRRRREEEEEGGETGDSEEGSRGAGEVEAGPGEEAER
jgi:hypothetical protein